MKKVILGLSLLLMLVQNGFATTDAEYDRLASASNTELGKYHYTCMKDAMNHSYTGDVNNCLKAIELFEQYKDYPSIYSQLPLTLLNASFLYDVSERNYVKAHEYYIKAAKLGNIQAQTNLDIMCREHSWVCR